MDRSLRNLAIALVVGAMAPLFDSTIVSVALHSLAADLDAPVATIQWVSTGYLLALGVDRAGRRLAAAPGRRQAALDGGAGLFLVGSVLCSLAWSAESLIAFRVVQGIGGGAMLPLLTTLLMQAAGGQDLGRLMAVVSPADRARPDPRPGGRRPDPRRRELALAVLGERPVRASPGSSWPVPDPGRRGDRRARLDVVGLVLLSPARRRLLYGLSGVGEAGGFARAGGVGSAGRAGSCCCVAFTAWALRRRGAALVDMHCCGTVRSLRQPRCCSWPAPRSTARCCCFPCPSRSCAGSTCSVPGCC